MCSNNLIHFSRLQFTTSPSQRCSRIRRRRHHHRLGHRVTATRKLYSAICWSRGHQYHKNIWTEMVSFIMLCNFVIWLDLLIPQTVQSSSLLKTSIWATLNASETSTISSDMTSIIYRRSRRQSAAWIPRNLRWLTRTRPTPTARYRWPAPTRPSRAATCHRKLRSITTSATISRRARPRSSHKYKAEVNFKFLELIKLRLVPSNLSTDNFA